MSADYGATMMEVHISSSLALQCVQTCDTRLVTPGTYEGGAKIWECCIDLCRWLSSDERHELPVAPRVLELGCGQALPSMTLFHSASHIVLQDLNVDCVERAWLNFIANYGVDETKQKVEMIAGDWRSLLRCLRGARFDLILASEVLYDVNHYDTLIDIIQKSLEEDGVCLIASKTAYFGLSGSVIDFCQQVEHRRRGGSGGALPLQVESVERIEDLKSTVREILRITHAK